MAEILTDSQLRQVKRLIRGLCANYDNGCCLILDGVCPQCISYTLFVANRYLAIKRTHYFAGRAPACGYGGPSVNGRRKTAAKIEKVKSSIPYAVQL